MPARVPEVLTERGGFLRKIIHSFELVMINNVGLPDWLVTNNICIETFVKVVVWICQICHMDFSKLLYGFVKELVMIFPEMKTVRQVDW